LTSPELVDKLNLAMFVLNQQLKRVCEDINQVVYLSSSINRPVVVLPGESPEPAQAYVCIVRKDKVYEIYIYLHLIHSNRPIIYQWDQGAVSRDRVSQVQQEALSFTESMGFMMSDLRWRELAPAEKEELYNSLPIFYEDISRFKEEVEEEILEIEPAEEEELVVEPIEEAPETVTEGDFSLDESAFAEEQSEGEQLPEIPSSQPAKEFEVGEEDILLDQLEIKEEPGQESVTSVPEVKIEIEEEPEAETIPEQVSEPSASVEIAEPEIKEEVSVPFASEPEPQEQEEGEEILINLEAKPDSAPAEPVSEPQPEVSAPAEPEEKKEVEEVIFSPQQAPEESREEKPAQEKMEQISSLTEEEKELIARFLAMF